jgi:chromosomal replication initiation ATPase DnaA
MPDPSITAFRDHWKRISRIKEIVCTHYGVEVSIINSRAKPEEVSNARQVGMWISHVLCGGMAHIIAKHFNRTKNSVRYTIRTMEGRLGVDKKLKEAVDALTDKCR